MLIIDAGIRAIDPDYESLEDVLDGLADLGFEHVQVLQEHVVGLD